MLEAGFVCPFMTCNVHFTPTHRSETAELCIWLAGFQNLRWEPGESPPSWRSPSWLSVHLQRSRSSACLTASGTSELVARSYCEQPGWLRSARRLLWSSKDPPSPAGELNRSRWWRRAPPTPQSCLQTQNQWELADTCISWSRQVKVDLSLFWNTGSWEMMIQHVLCSLVDVVTSTACFFWMLVDDFVYFVYVMFFSSWALMWVCAFWDVFCNVAWRGSYGSRDRVKTGNSFPLVNICSIKHHLFMFNVCCDNMWETSCVCWFELLTSDLCSSQPHCVPAASQSVSHSLKQDTAVGVWPVHVWSQVDGELELTAGAFRKPLMAWNTPPPMAPIVNAPPQSSTILQGLQGNRILTI